MLIHSIIKLFKLQELVTLNEYLRTPNEAWKTPAKNVAVKTKRIYKCGFPSGDTSLPILDARISDTTATVPTARSLELPKITYIIGGTKLESVISKHHIQ